MKITIRFGRNSHSVECQPEDKLITLKEEIDVNMRFLANTKRVFHVDMDLTSFLYSGKWLDNNTSFLQNNITKDCELIMLRYNKVGVRFGDREEKCNYWCPVYQYMQVFSSALRVRFIGMANFMDRNMTWLKGRTNLFCLIVVCNESS